ncbi:hypothetical protein BpHYR1_004981 [Brachionus plicatilis]|uniref:Uncharacterized protein n=1 Tax=Brachionus plicatilis TaxID=10195 RepID=A0A3M7S371_BRAPC|nr:hypothetical protein BpHYR1_004981 [Brachionus plicatilis]
MTFQHLLDYFFSDSFRSFSMDVQHTNGQLLKGSFKIRMENGEMIYGSFHDKFLIVIYDGFHTFELDFCFNGPLRFFKITGDNFMLSISGLIVNFENFKLFDGSIDLSIGNLNKNSPFKFGFNLSLKTMECLSEMWSICKNLEKENFFLKQMLQNQSKHNSYLKIVKLPKTKKSVKRLQKKPNQNMR